ncbi:tryptophan--tRNA ligase [Hirschia baltica]|uniref:Tryptophan--tRNA ligase n=1 Tax=Hirschia baltica (strain ATCC 49814 / DSM 5838 / IFAM 1418) TaxID=582402 RepID=C6XIF6_HIRBI|nr:tryptophan--tRNA ligase [Hirschia baltica]ACT60763.1 tryptophanyl-tRNA synthetase [Hirschia baltica ATCC 49814]
MSDLNTGYQGPERVFSGMQPSGDLHLGNYLGALINWVNMQDAHECVFCAVDLHAITVPQDPKLLAGQTREIVAAWLAAGIDPKKNIVFAQSSVRAHTELAWILNCTARMGWAERMTQFKDKAGKDAERASVGLFTYPVLMAADILAYKATHVPVGDDQKQHLELTRDCANRFNRDFNAPDFFPIPEPLIQGPGARIMSLKDGTKKMSKSDPSELSRINLIDDADTIAKKIKKAKSDADVLPSEVEGLDGRPEARNLVGIYGALSNKSSADVLAEFGGEGFGKFKPALAELAVEKMAPISQKMRDYIADPAQIDAVLEEGAERASSLADPILKEVRQIVGFWGN